MKSLIDFINESLEDSTVYLLKTYDDAKSFFGRKLKSGVSLQDEAGIYDDELKALYEYCKENNMPAPIVGCYGNVKFNFAFRRWFNENAQSKIINEDGNPFTFNKDSRYFKQYHDTKLKEDGKFVPTAQDYEELICFSYNKIYGIFENDEENCKAIGISPKKADNLINYYNANAESIDAISKVLYDKFKCKAGYGKLKNTTGDKITKEWQDTYETGKANTTPKTDIVSLDEGSYRLSLKEAHGSQIMSAKTNEAKATLLFAVEPLKENIKGEVLPILCNLLNVNETDKKRKENTEEIFDEFGPEYLNGKTLRERMNEDPEFRALIENSKKKGKGFEAQLNKLLSEYEDYKESFYIEAMTGNHKFTENSKCAANYVFTWDAVNPDNNKIYTPKDYYEKVKDKSKVVVDFKSWPTSNVSGQTLKIITQ